MAKIMVVDDEPQILTLVKIMFEMKGYQVSEAKSGAECLRKLKNEKPDLILLDIMMPGEDGWEILKEIKKDKETKDIPVVMFSVRTSKDSIKKSLEYGADAHINKPFDLDYLLNQVKSLLEKDTSI